MRTVLQIVPAGWPCTLEDCPPGLFVFLAASGEVFWGGAVTHEQRCRLVVQPCQYEWEDSE